MIVPAAGRTFKENLRIVVEVYHTLGKLLVKKKGLSAKNLGDEGGFAPDLQDPHEALSIIEEAIGLAGFKVGVDVFLALDCAASEFYAEGKYEIEKGKVLNITHSQTGRKSLSFFVVFCSSLSADVSVLLVPQLRRARVVLPQAQEGSPGSYLESVLQNTQLIMRGRVNYVLRSPSLCCRVCVFSRGRFR